MAQKLVTELGEVYIPGAYPRVIVESSDTSIATTGVVMLVGEAEEGPDYSNEIVEENWFSPDQEALVKNKYGSGPLVDAFIGAARATDDPLIAGAPSRIYFVKTNKGTKASAELGSYGTIVARNAGEKGNLINVAIKEEQAGVNPSTGNFAFIPTNLAEPIEILTSTEKEQFVITDEITASEFVDDINASGAAQATGGTEREYASIATQVDILPRKNGNVTFKTIGGWAYTPVPGSVINLQTGWSEDNKGFYIVASATQTTVHARAVSGQSPVAEQGSGLVGWDPIAISAQAGKDKIGETLVIYGPSGAFYTAQGNIVPWLNNAPLGSTDKPFVINSNTEYAVRIEVSSGNGTEVIVAGGQPVLDVVPLGIPVPFKVTIEDGEIDVQVNGTSKTVQAKLGKFPSVGSLAEYLSAQFSNLEFSPATAVVATVSPLDLDEGVFDSDGAAIRIKKDGADVFRTINEQSNLVELIEKGDGLPSIISKTFLSGGSKGGTTQEDIANAINVCSRIQGNFLVPLFSRNAIEDIEDGLTDPSSTYEIDGIVALARNHVNSMSTFKRRRPRQAFCSFKGGFREQKLMASNLNSPRVSLSWLDVLNLNSNGQIQAFPPWMEAAIAAGAQAAAFNQAIFAKNLAINGAFHSENEFSDQDDTQLEDALRNGLLTIRRSDAGGFEFVSDQTTYGTDTNFVYNSIQAMYATDIVSQTVAQRLENAFLGRSVADITAASALSEIRTIMGDLRNLGLIASSDDAPTGYRNARVEISGGTMKVTIEIKLAGAIYFIPITMLVSPVTQTASS